MLDLRTALAPVLLVLTILAWAALTLWVFTSDVVSAATLVPLLVLIAGVEALVALRAPGIFAPVFGLATAVNFLPAAISGTAEELTGIGIAHALFALRIVIAMRRAHLSNQEPASTATKNAPAE
jgi:hypothetical protein